MGRDWNEPEGETDRYQIADERDARPRKRREKLRGRRGSCKGRPGIPHIWLWEDDPSWTYHKVQGCKRQVLTCFGCGSTKRFQWRWICLTCGGRRAGYWTWRGDDQPVTCTCGAPRPKRWQQWQPQGQEHRP